MNVGGAGTSAMRRRQRRLRAMLRHERQTVAMELAAALHHSRDEGRVTNCGLRTGTEDSQFRWAAGHPERARAAGRGSHCRLRGCPGSASRGVVDGWG